MFKSKLEDLKKKQTEMNNKIPEMKNILEGINSRINEAEERIRELEDRMAEITATEQRKEKRMKKIRTVKETSGTFLDAPTFTLYESQDKRDRKHLRKYLKRLIAENFPNMGKEKVTQVQEAQSLIMD